MSSKPPIHFGPFEVTDQVFHQSSLCFALVNLKPIFSGHVLVVPFRPAQHLTDLSRDEVSDLFSTVQKVQKMLARTYFGSSEATLTGGKVGDGSFNVAIQDGKWAGQTVPHVHCHVIPRLKGDDAGDEVYERLESEEGNVGGGLWDRRRPAQHGTLPKIEDSDRKPRSAEDMQKEAAFFREQMALVEAEE